MWQTCGAELLPQLRSGGGEVNMTRQQAEHLLDAYVDLENGGGDNKARQSLREVILDAMASELPNRNIITYHNGVEVER